MTQRIETAMYVVCTQYDITTEQLRSASHKWQFADARAILCYILHEKWHLSLMEVGKLLHRHHSTVLCATRKVKMWLDNPKIFAQENYQYEQIIERIKALT